MDPNNSFKKEPKFTKSFDNFFNFNKHHISSSADKNKFIQNNNFYETDNNLNKRYNNLLLELKDLEKEEKNDFEKNKERENSPINNNNDDNYGSEDIEDLCLFKNIDNMLNSNDLKDEDKIIESQQFDKKDNYNVTYQDFFNLSINLMKKKQDLKFKKLKNMVNELKIKYKNKNKKKNDEFNKMIFNKKMNKNLTNKPNYLIEKEKKDKEKKLIMNNMNNLNKIILEKRVDDANEILRKIEDQRLAKIEEMKEMDKKANELNKREKDINVLENEINRKKNKINEDLKKLDGREKEINEKKRQISEKEKQINEKEKEVNKAKKENEEKENIINQKNKDLDIKYKDLKENERLINEKENENKKAIEQINQDKNFLLIVQQEQENLNIEFNQREEKIKEEKKIIEKEKLYIEEEKKIIEKEKQQLKEEKNKINEEKINLEKKKKEIKEREEKLDSQFAQYINSLDEIEIKKQQLNNNLEVEKQKIKKDQEYIKKSRNDIENREKKLNDEKNLLEKEKKIFEKEKKILEKEKTKIRLNNILNDTFNANNNNQKSEEEKISDIIFLGSVLKHEIKKEKIQNSNNIINVDNEIKNYNNNNPIILPLYLISTWLKKNGCEVVIEKKAKNTKLNNLCLQHVFTQKAINKKFTICFDFGKENNELLLNTNRCESFIKSLKSQISNDLVININDIFVMNPRGPDFTVDLYINNLEEDKIDQVYKYIETRKGFINTKISVLLEGCKLSSDIFEPEFDMEPINWPQGKNYRGKLPYNPPYDYFGCALKVRGSYDSGDDTWLGHINIDGEFAVAYHGIRSNLDAVKGIMNSYLKAGANQYCRNDDDMMHPGKKCGKGVYVTPDIKVAEEYTEGFGVFELNKTYRIVLQCRVNPKKIRQSAREPEYWILNGNGKEIRPYRILIKEVSNN